MCDGSVQDGAQKGIALADAPSWAAGGRLMPQSAMHAMTAPTSIPYAPGTKVVAPSNEPAPNAPSIPQSPLKPAMNFEGSGAVGQPFQVGDTTVYSPLGNGGIGLQNFQVPNAPAQIPGQAGQFQPVGQPMGNGDQSITTGGANPVTFQKAAAIQSALPQVQSTNGTPPSSISTPNTSQSPTQPNPSANQSLAPHDQALDKGLDFTFQELEGPERTREHNGRISVYGIGSDPGEPIPKNKAEAKQFFVERYINNNSQRMKIMNQLNTPQDVNAYAQYVINAQGKADQFSNKYQGNIGGDEWRNALFHHQAMHYNNLANTNPQKFGGDLPGWVARIRQSRNFNPTGDNT